MDRGHLRRCPHRSNDNRLDWTASAADNRHQRGPNPARSGVAASLGTFATAQVDVPAGGGFGGGVIHYPTDTGPDRFGAVAIAPGYTARWAAEGAWKGP
ncbi:hypothetical protein ALI22I_03040 [Saccharothrix sp. ALI-22-I]|uniref:poly(ethylene terephthalate) hydrolase family protein n=1 Tax=Saccharothrix sp. ALI-22-I TaxID=1933778 RepID=UPI00097C3102|nr:hypothetical protein ALI22I_03040 [Saccharothrix sp. ALI-22-I]